MTLLEALGGQNLYQGYTYAYPHKLAYRNIAPTHLKKVWQDEDIQQLFLYVHIPFCEMRCGFCNLLTIANPKKGIAAYLNALQRQAEVYQQYLPQAKYTSYAIGGGTPTFLEVEELGLLFETMAGMGLAMSHNYGSIEASPKTLSADKITLIANQGITRLSMGVQSWVAEENKALGRPQDLQVVESTVSQLAASAIPEFNLDLIYGAAGQTPQSFLYSIEKTLDYAPTEIFLYPLYVRHQTGLEKRANTVEDHRHTLYLAGRDALLNAGYIQTSMRCFRKENAPHHNTMSSYDALENGMVGLGAGARSYTRQLHYSTHYAVNKTAIKSIIENYTTTEDFSQVAYGISLTETEQKRRFVIKAITDGGRLSPSQYHQRFKSDVFEDFEMLNALTSEGWLAEKEGFYQLTLKGMCYEDVIGPALYSEPVKQLIEKYSWD